MPHPWVDACLRRPRLVAFVTVALVGLALVGALRLRLDFSSNAFYGRDSLELEALADFQRRWGADDRELILAIQTPDPDGWRDVSRMQILATLGERLTTDPDVVDVVSLATISEAAARLGASVGLERLRIDPRVVPALLSSDGRTAALVVRLSRSTEDLAWTVRVVDRLRAVVGTAPQADAFEIEWAGIPAIRAAFFRLTLRDQAIFVPVLFALIGATVALAYRSWVAILITGVAAALPNAMLLGIMGWSNEPIGLLNQAYFTLLPVIAVADSIHLLERVDEERTRGIPLLDAVAIATTRVGRACLFSSVSTAVGFLSLTLSSTPILRGFGLYAAIGIMAAWSMVVTVVPTLILHLSRGTQPRPHRGNSPYLRRLPTLVVRYRWIICSSFGLVTALSIWSSRGIEVDNKLTGLLRPSHPVAAASRTLDEELGGTLSLEVEFRLDARARGVVSSLEQWARDQPETRTVIRESIDDPQNRGASHVRVSLRTPDLGGRAFATFQERAFDHLAEYLADPATGPATGQVDAQEFVRPMRIRAPDLDLRLTGTTSVAYRGINRMAEELRTSLGLVLVVVIGLVGVLLRSLRLALLSTVPNVIPLVIGYAALGWIGVDADPLALVILAVALSIAVDDTMHILVRYQEEMELTRHPEHAMSRALSGTGRALIVTTIALGLGLGANAFSAFPPLQTLGLLGGITLSTALLADLFLIPALLLPRSSPLVRPGQSPPTRAPEPPPGSAPEGATTR